MKVDEEGEFSEWIATCLVIHLGQTKHINYLKAQKTNKWCDVERMKTLSIVFSGLTDMTNGN